MTELALMLPVLCLIMVITIDYSRLFYALSTITDCARDGALYFANHPTAPASSIQQAALADAVNLTNPAPTVATSGPTTSGAGYTTVQVTVNYRFTTLFNYPGVPRETNLSRKVVMMVTPP
ncbi:TadE/TadG family type IV pilus assembly protein [Tundrisphaera sp. TA3]|uniref:TadE/TadG family type IV pilus assembly protein n=1 Tax=Tundrisphaera sp. TA3 TaxID=3435775 RepID=UPI003EB8F742